MATLGFLLVLAAASDVDVEAELESPKLSCFRRGWGYEDSWHKDLNGGFVANAETCQETCDHMWFCDVFTYYEDTKKCFLQGNQAIEMVKTTAISGPKTCSATSLSEALKMVKHAGWSAAKGAQAEAMNLQQIKIAGVQAVQQNGVKLGLSNTQKAQVTAGVVGMIAAVKAAGDGNSVTPQLAAASLSAAEFAAVNHTLPYQAQQAMYAAGSVAGDFSLAREETVQDRCDYAVRMALDAADTVKGNGLTQEQQLIIAAQEGALVVAEAGGTKKETYTAVGTALHKVAELYDHPEDIQAEWQAVGEAAALDWWEESFTKDVVDSRLDFKAILQIATDAAHDAEANGAGLNDEILAAAQAAQVASAERGYETREQAREASIAAADVARSLPGDLMTRADAAKLAAEKVTGDLGLTQATAQQEGERAKHLVLNGDAEQAAVAGTEAANGAGLAAANSEGLVGAGAGLAGTVAAGAGAANVRAGTAFDSGDGADAAAEAEAALRGAGTGEGGVALTDGVEGEGGALDQSATKLGASAGTGEGNRNNFLVDAALIAAAVLALLACCTMAYMCMNGKKSKKAKTTRHLKVQREVEDEEQQPLMASAEVKTGASTRSGTEPNPGAGHAGGAWQMASMAPTPTPQFNMYAAQPIRTQQQPMSTMSAVPITTAAPLSSRAAVPMQTGSVSMRSAGMLTPPAPAPNMGTAYRLASPNPPAYPVKSGYIVEGSTLPPAEPTAGTQGVQITTTSFNQPSLGPILVQEQQMPTGQTPVMASLNVGHEVRQITYLEWHQAWRPGLPRDVVFTIPEGAQEGAPLIVEVEPGIVVPTTVPQGAYAGALACLQR